MTRCPDTSMDDLPLIASCSFRTTRPIFLPSLYLSEHAVLANPGEIVCQFLSRPPSGPPTKCPKSSIPPSTPSLITQPLLPFSAWPPCFGDATNALPSVALCAEERKLSPPS